MAVTTKKLFSATTNATTTVFSPVSIQLNNQDDLDVYVTLSGGTRVLQLRQATGSTAQSSHPQVNNTDGLYFPAVTAGTTLYNYTLSTDNNTITFNSALPQGAVVFCERRTRDADSSYTSFASGSTIRATDLNNSSTESNFTAQDGRNKALTIEGVLFRGDQASTNFVTTDHIVNGTIVEADIANSAITSNKIADNAVTTTEILNGAVTTAKLAADAIDGTRLADNAVDSEHYTDGSIDRVHLEADIIDSTKLADNAVNSEHYVDGSIDHVHLANDIIDGDNIQDDVINSEHIAAGALDNEHYAAGSITSDKLNGATVVTNSEQSGYSVNDTSFFTTSAAEARYFNASTGETIKDGDTFPDNDTTIATTAAINDRIIDLIDDVGGFVPIANETSFPNANPDVNNGAGTIVSVAAASASLNPSGTTLTIANGTVGNSTVTITGNAAVIPAGFGFLVETTSTLNTYTFHRLVPKATEVTTVAGKATEIGRLGTADAVADMAILGTADVVADLNTLGTADIVADMNMLAVSDVISDMNTLAVTDVINDMDTVATNVTNVNNVGNSIANVNTTAGSIANVNTVAGSISNVNTVGGAISNVNTTAGSISNVNTVASNISSVNSFFNTYRIGANNPTTSLDVGDLFFNTTSNSLKVYTGSAWVDGVTATGNFAVVTGNTFTGSNLHNDNVKSIYGTGSDLEIFHDGSHSKVLNTTGNLFLGSNGSVDIGDGGYSEYAARFVKDGAASLYYDNSKKFETTSTGVSVTGGLSTSGSSTFNQDVTFIGDTTHLTWDRSNRTLQAQDNAKIKFGTSGDTQIYHDGTNSKITHSGSGGLYIGADTFGLQKADHSENYITMAANGAVELYYNNIKKLATTANGIKLNDDTRIGLGDGEDLQIYHDGTDSFIDFSNALKISDDTVIKTVFANAYLGLVDNYELIVGTGLDLKIYHTGSHSYIDQTANSGDLYIRQYGTSNSILFNGASSEQFAKFTHNGSCEFYYDNNKKLETSANGVEIPSGSNRCLRIFGTNNVHSTSGLVISQNNSTDSQLRAYGSDASTNGRIQFNSSRSDGTNSFNIVYDSGNLEFPDNQKATFGTGNDVQIYHDGNSRIKHTGAGVLSIQGDDIRIHSEDASEFMAKFVENGAVELYYDNSKKFETYTNGTKLYGHLIGLEAGKYVQWQGASSTAFAIGMTSGADSPTGSDQHLQFHHWNNSSWDKVFFVHRDYINMPDNKKIGFGDSNDLQIYHDGSHSRIVDAGTGVLAIQGPDIRIHNEPANELMADFVANGAVSLYYDNNKKFETTAGGATITGELNVTTKVAYPDNAKAIFGTGDDLQIYHDGTTSWIKNTATDLVINTPNLYVNNSGQTETMISASQNGAVNLKYDNGTKFSTVSNGAIIDNTCRIENINNQVSSMVNAKQNIEFKVHQTNGQSALQGAIKSNGVSGWGGQLEFYTKNADSNPSGSLIGYLTLNVNGHLLPTFNNTQDLGSASQRWRNIYTNDLQLSNEGSSNDVDGTWGDWTMQEGESDLFLKNNRSGKTYKFNLTEVS